MNSKQFDTALRKIKNYYNSGLITESEHKERLDRLLKEWYATPRYW